MTLVIAQEEKTEDVTRPIFTDAFRVVGLTLKRVQGLLSVSRSSSSDGAIAAQFLL